MATWNENDEIDSLFMQRPHVLLLGAGASYAAFPNGDKNGIKLPVMKNFVEILNLEKILQNNGINGPYDDFEAIYSDIAINPALASLKKNIEHTIQEYFSSLELPDHPTLYDHIILSLRPKDIIATFNWDPFLSQAVVRNLQFIKQPPEIFFLHGNVTYRYCPDCKIGLPTQISCKDCGAKLKTAPLLYPVKEKNYQTHQVIKAHWDGFRHYLKSAWALTIFGYSAPKTDVDAIELMKKSWGNIETREFEQIEIIDIGNKTELLENWNSFIHTHHYDIHRSFYDSYIAKFPRRSGEAIWSQFLENKWLNPKEFPKDKMSFGELYEWLSYKMEREKSEQCVQPDPQERAIFQ